MGNNLSQICSMHRGWSFQSACKPTCKSEPHCNPFDIFFRIGVPMLLSAALGLFRTFIKIGLRRSNGTVRIGYCPRLNFATLSWFWFDFQINFWNTICDFDLNQNFCDHSQHSTPFLCDIRVISVYLTIFVSFTFLLSVAFIILLTCVWQSKIKYLHCALAAV